MHTQTLEYIFWLPDWKILSIIGFYFVHFSIYLSIPHCVYCWRFIIHFASWWENAFIISSLVCSSKEGTISLVVALSVTPVLSGVTGHTLSLLCYRESRGFVSCFHCICDFDSGDCSNTVLKKKKLSVQTIFSVMFCWELAGCEIGSEAYLTSHSFDHLTSCSFLPPFHTASYLSLHPLEESGISIPQRTQPPGECNQASL